MSVYPKDPDEVLDFSMDWTVDVLATGESISSSVWAVEGGDGLLVVGTTANASGVTSAFVSAGTKGQVYTLRNRIVTDMGRTYDRSWTIRVEPR